MCFVIEMQFKIENSHLNFHTRVTNVYVRININEFKTRRETERNYIYTNLHKTSLKLVTDHIHLFSAFLYLT